VQYDFLANTAELTVTPHWRAVAILTPTNHGLLHQYIDVPDYSANLQILRRALERRGVRVLNYDSAFAPNEFIDNDHLTAAGNARLADMLLQDLKR